jgi:hypothetical protein
MLRTRGNGTDTPCIFLRCTLRDFVGSPQHLPPDIQIRGGLPVTEALSSAPKCGTCIRELDFLSKGKARVGYEFGPMVGIATKLGKRILVSRAAMTRFESRKVLTADYAIPQMPKIYLALLSIPPTRPLGGACRVFFTGRESYRKVPGGQPPFGSMEGSYSS